MKTKLSKEAVAVAYAARQDVIKPILESVHIGDGEIKATDGYMLVGHKIETEGEPILLNAKALLAFQAAFSQGKELTITTDDDKNATVEVSGVSISIKVEQGNYPSTAIPYKKLGEPKAYVALQVEFLKRLIQLAADSKVIQFRIRSNRDPVEFIVGDIYGLIMPVAMPEESELWHKWQEVREVRSIKAGDTISLEGIDKKEVRNEDIYTELPR